MLVPSAAIDATEIEYNPWGGKAKAVPGVSRQSTVVRYIQGV
jgi:hypothetical protein